MRFMVPFLLGCCLLAGCSKVDNPRADDLDAFVAGGFDDVTVYAIDSSRPKAPTAMDLDEYTRWTSEVDSSHFHRFPIQKQVLITDKDEGRKLVATTTAGMRKWAEGAKCFEPHHGLRVRKGSTFFDLVICYSCGHVEVWGTTERGRLVPTSDKSQSALDAVLKRVKP